MIVQNLKGKCFSWVWKEIWVYWFRFGSLRSWFRKLVPSSQPIRWKVNNFSSRFPRLMPITWEYWFFNGFLFLFCSDWSLITLLPSSLVSGYLIEKRSKHWFSQANDDRKCERFIWPCTEKFKSKCGDC